jgi:hypothetical protein
MKGEAREIVERLLDIIKGRLVRGRRADIRLRKMVCEIQACPPWQEPSDGGAIVLDARRMVTWQYSPVRKRSVNCFGTDK